jgi:hypothetical protein
LDIIRRIEAFSEKRIQPALVRYDGFLLFTVGNPNPDKPELNIDD